MCLLAATGRREELVQFLGNGQRAELVELERDTDIGVETKEIKARERGKFKSKAIIIAHTHTQK